jgi:hypothetical protein
MSGRSAMARISRRLPMKHQGQTVSEITSICMRHFHSAKNLAGHFIFIGQHMHDVALPLISA